MVATETSLSDQIMMTCPFNFNKLFVSAPPKRCSSEINMSFDDLPVEVIKIILDYLDQWSLVQMLTCNSYIFQMTKPKLYQDILVYDIAFHRRLNLSKGFTSLPKELQFMNPENYTILSTRNFLDLISRYTFEPNLVNTIYFYHYVPSKQLFSQCAKFGCKIKIKDRDVDSDNSTTRCHCEMKIGNTNVDIEGSLDYVLPELGMSFPEDLKHITSFKGLSLRHANDLNCYKKFFSESTVEFSFKPNVDLRQLIKSHDIRFQPEKLSLERGSWIAFDKLQTASTQSLRLSENEWLNKNWPSLKTVELGENLMKGYAQEFWKSAPEDQLEGVCCNCKSCEYDDSSFLDFTKMNSVKFYGWKSSSSIEYYLVLKSSECRESLLSETENQMVKIPSYISKLPSLKTVAFSDRLYWVKHYDRTMELIPVFEDFGTSSIYLSEAFI